MLKAVIFDLNGIFIQSPKLSERFAKDFGVPVETFLPKLSEIMEKVRRPNAGSAFSYWKPVLEEWKLNLTEKEFWDFWFGAEKVSDVIVNFAKKLKSKNVKMFILSNNFKERADYYNHYPWMHDVIDKMYVSWQTGFVKPDPKAWSWLLEDNNLKAEECIYFDDQEKNLKASESVGVKSFMFINESELIQIVERELVN